VARIAAVVVAVAAVVVVAAVVAVGRRAVASRRGTTSSHGTAPLAAHSSRAMGGVGTSRAKRPLAQQSLAQRLFATSKLRAASRFKAMASA
jgi:hypothetical protein